METNDGRHPRGVASILIQEAPGAAMGGQRRKGAALFGQNGPVEDAKVLFPRANRVHVLMR